MRLKDNTRHPGGFCVLQGLTCQPGRVHRLPTYLKYPIRCSTRAQAGGCACGGRGGCGAPFPNPALEAEAEGEAEAAADAGLCTWLGGALQDETIQ